MICTGIQTRTIMLRSPFFLLTLTVANITNGQLTPEHPARLEQHLLEVNPQWTKMEQILPDVMTTVRFTSEADRIAAHLHHVHAYLSTHTPTEISPAQHSRRHALLGSLNTYADRGVFPMNDIVPGRSPVFIDKLGNACAVGHLMITSGHAELAERIHEELNLAYVHDIGLPEVAAWAATNGFTVDELAWIQPTYDRMKIRDPRLLASLRMTNGDQIIVHGPANAQAAQKLSLLRKESTGHKRLAILPMLSGVQVVEFDGRVFVGGIPEKKGHSAELYEWNGKSLVAHDPFTGHVGIGALYVQNEALHVRAFPLDEGQYMERYLTEANVWEIVGTSQHDVAPIDVVPERHVP